MKIQFIILFENFFPEGDRSRGPHDQKCTIVIFYVKIGGFFFQVELKIMFSFLN